MRVLLLDFLRFGSATICFSLFLLRENARLSHRVAIRFRITSVRSSEAVFIVIRFAIRSLFADRKTGVSNKKSGPLRRRNQIS